MISKGTDLDYLVQSIDDDRVHELGGRTVFKEVGGKVALERELLRWDCNVKNVLPLGFELRPAHSQFVGVRRPDAIASA